MSIEQSLSQAPLGLQDIELDETPAVEIEIVNPEGVKIGMDGVEIDLMPETEEEDFSDNLAEYMDDSELQKIASDLIEMVDTDVNSRKDWVEMYVKGLDVLGMKYEERTEPWLGACGVFSTVLTEAAVRFQSETIIETFPAQGPVKTEIIGAIDKLKEEAAERVKDDMNYRLTEGMPEYRPEHERLLYSLGLAGAAFKKVYYDPSLGRQASIFIPAEDVIIPYGASSAMTSERVTHIMRKTKNDIRKLQVSGFYLDKELGEPLQFYTDVEKKKAEDQGYNLNDDDRYQIYEIHVDYDLPGYEDEDGIALPYVITLERGTTEILSIRRNWDEDDKHKLKRQHFVQYTYVPGFGAYGLGLIHLIGGYARAGTSIIRQLVDAGTLSNLPGGLKTRGLRIKGDDTPIQPGEFRDVDVPSGSVKENIMALPYKEPSQVLLALLNQITDEGRRLGSIADMNISDMSANSPVGTTLALLERQLKTMSAVQARVHYSMKQEFKLLKEIIRDYMPEDYEYTPVFGTPQAKRADYDMVDVIPVSDPNSATMAQRIMQYQAALQLSQQAPQLYDMGKLHRQMLEVLGIQDASDIIKLPEDIKPADPVTENMMLLKQEPVKAFKYQDHEAHIAVHMAAMQDPKMRELVGQSPFAQAIGQAMAAHVTEHVAFQYRRNIEKMLGVELPNEDQALPEDVEIEISRLAKDAAEKLLQKDQAEAQAAQAQQQMQDPVVQMQQQELQLKQQELQHKIKMDEAKLQLDALNKQTNAQLQAQRISSENQRAGAQIGARLAAELDKGQREDKQAGAKLGIEIAKELAKGDG